MTDNNKPLCILDHGTDRYGQPRYREASSGLLCQAHRERLDADVQEVETLWCELNLVIDGSGVQGTSERVSRGKMAEAPAPLDLTAAALRDARTHSQRTVLDQSEPMPAVPSVVASWLLLVAEERPIEGTLPRGTVGQLRLLAKHHNWIAGHEWADDYVRELAEMRKALRSAVRDHSHWLFGRCMLPTEDSPRCNGALLKENGTEIITCKSCRARWVTPQEQARLSVMLEDETRARMEQAAS